VFDFYEVRWGKDREFKWILAVGWDVSFGMMSGYLDCTATGVGRLESRLLESCYAVLTPVLSLDRI